MPRPPATAVRPGNYLLPLEPQQAPFHYLPVWMTVLAMFGFQFGAVFDIWLIKALGGYSIGISLGLVLMLPLLIYVPAGLQVVTRSRFSIWPMLMLTGVLAFVAMRLPFAMSASNVRNVTTPLGWVLVPCAAAAIFRYYWPSLSRALPTIIYSLVIFFILWVVLSFQAGWTFRSETGLYDAGRITRYFLSGLNPNELSLVFGVQLCYCLFLVRCNRGIRLLNIALVASCVVNTIVISGSRGGIAGMALVCIMYILSGSLTRQLRLVIVAGLILLMTAGVLAPYIATMRERAETLVRGEEQENFRVALYKDVWSHAIRNPIFGIGLGGYLAKTTRLGHPHVPHQNVLGLACEAGIPAAVFYVLFILTAAYALWIRSPQRGESPLTAEAKYFITACLWVFAYLQFRGLFMDTASMKEMYFCVGAGLGLREWLKCQANPRPVVRR